MLKGPPFDAFPEFPISVCRGALMMILGKVAKLNCPLLSAEIRSKPRRIVRPFVRPAFVDPIITLSISMDCMNIWSE